MRRRTPYTIGAPFYDVLSGEPVYRAGRVAGIRLLGLDVGDVVLDLGCGTGLNFPLLQAAVGPPGRVIGLDRSEQMLRVARRRIERHGWRNVFTVRADATAFTLEDLPTDRVDAVLATYSLSVISDPAAAWRRITEVVRHGERRCGIDRPGGRVCIVDMQPPTGCARVLAPIARLVCAFGDSDIDARPWEFLRHDALRVRSRSLRGGHIQVVAGVMP